jgi:2-polyprenyl-3-methyl-5-hydroxy-6-metoxy-1,4-benzoquinol methylase
MELSGGGGIDRDPRLKTHVVMHRSPDVDRGVQIRAARVKRERKAGSPLSEREGQGTFDPTEYWQKRLSARYSLGSTGWSSLGEAFNEWSYAVRRRVFTRVARDALLERECASVLDVGSGTGFYLDLWQRLGVSQITGSDLTSVAVERLAGHFPTTTIRKVDIGEADVPLPAGAYDAISIIDVLYHIVDDERYAQALSNLSRLLKPNGTLLLSENLVARQSRSIHQVTRSRGWILSALAGAGLVVVHEYPIFFLMNTPVNSDSRLLHHWWDLVARIVPRHEAIGWMVGATLFPIELGLTRLAADRRSPSTTLVVCRRRPE